MHVQEPVAALRRGQVVAYPCEGVWGLGCDPNNAAAVHRLLTLKGRSEQRGLILVAGAMAQLVPYLDTGDRYRKARQRAQAFWPGAVTCLLPSSQDCPQWLSGEHSGTLAVRISDHPPVRSLCEAFEGAIVSTSANPSGQRAATCRSEVIGYFGDGLMVAEGAETGSLQGPTPILDAVRNLWVRGAPPGDS